MPHRLRNLIFLSVLAANATAPTAFALVPITATPFEVESVRLLPSPFQTAQARDADYLLSLDPDRLLRSFRITAGLSTDAVPLGGWEKPDSEIRGHTLGHYLSACSIMYAATGDARFKSRVDQIVATLAECQRASPSQGYHPGYLSAYPESFFDRLDALQKVWVPYYTLHKIMAGLLDAEIHGHNAQAHTILLGLADWLKFRVNRLTPEQMQAVLKTEQGGMTESLANLYALTGNPDHLRLAQSFNHHAVIDPLARGDDPLTGLHANTQIPKIIGAAREYELTDDPRYRTIAENFWGDVAQHRSYVIGGHSDREFFFPTNAFAQHLGPRTAETCNTYNMLKLTRHLMGWAPTTTLGDFYERALYNDILASQDSRTGMMTYFMSMEPGHFKTFSTPEDSFWCCVGTGMENHARYGEGIYSQDKRSLFVHLFIPSVLTDPNLGLTLRQETGFPAEPSSHLNLHLEKPISFSLEIRHPAWAASAFAIRVNGAPAPFTQDGSGYAAVTREWHDGDQIAITLPMSLHTEALPGNPDLVAFMYGPIVLAGLLGKDNLPPGGAYAKDQNDFVKMPPVAVPEVDLHLIAASSVLTFIGKTTDAARQITFVPFYQVDDQRYSIYWHQ